MESEMGFLFDCHSCGKDVAQLGDHAPGCDAAESLARREIARLERSKGTPWETTSHEEDVRELRELLEKYEGETDG